MGESNNNPAPSGETIEQLQERYRSLNERRIQAETKLENASQQLATLKQQAREKYGTDDVAQLREKLDTMKAENEQKRKEYQESLEHIESELKSVEAEFAATTDEPEPGETA